MLLPKWLKVTGKINNVSLDCANIASNGVMLRVSFYRALFCKSLILLLLIVIPLGGCARRSGYARRRYPYSYRKGNLKGTIYKVRKGDTLWRIAKAYGVKLTDLAKVNRIKNPRKLEVGQKLFIPKVKRSVHRKPTKPRVLSKKKPKKKKKASVSYKAKEKFLLWPVKGRLSSAFGMRWGSRHEGIDIAVAKGTKIRAAATGKVIYSDNKMRYYGNVIIIKHHGGYFTVYAHNSANLVKAGTIIKQGQVIAEVGQSGRASGPHLHFEIRQGERPLNPLLYLPTS